MNKIQQVEDLSQEYLKLENLEEENGEDLTQEKQKICDQIYFILNEKKEVGKIV